MPTTTASAIYRGMKQKLDYIKHSGSIASGSYPFTPSPYKDDGYDISDFLSVHRDYGTLDDFKELLDAAHERGLKVIADLVVNHTSDQHAWFQEARQDPSSPYRDYYVWSDDPNKYADARIIFIDTEVSNWTFDPIAGQYFWHRFFSHQPDINYDNPAVQEEMLNILRFWLNLGLDGFRCDAVPYLFEREGTICENLPETHEFLRRLRWTVDKEFPGKILLAEANNGQKTWCSTSAPRQSPSSTWPSTSRHAPHLHGRTNGKIGYPSSRSWLARRRFPRARSGPSSCATTTS